MNVENQGMAGQLITTRPIYNARSVGVSGSSYVAEQMAKFGLKADGKGGVTTLEGDYNPARKMYADPYGVLDESPLGGWGGNPYPYAPYSNSPRPQGTIPAPVNYQANLTNSYNQIMRLVRDNEDLRNLLTQADVKEKLVNPSSLDDLSEFLHSKAGDDKVLSRKVDRLISAMVKHTESVSPATLESYKTQVSEIDKLFTETLGVDARENPYLSIVKLKFAKADPSKEIRDLTWLNDNDSLESLATIRFRSQSQARQLQFIDTKVYL